MSKASKPATLSGNTAATSWTTTAGTIERYSELNKYFLATTTNIFWQPLQIFLLGRYPGPGGPGGMPPGMGPGGPGGGGMPPGGFGSKYFCEDCRVDAFVMGI